MDGYRKASIFEASLDRPVDNLCVMVITEVTDRLTVIAC